MNRDPVPHTFGSWASRRTPRRAKGATHGRSRKHQVPAVGWSSAVCAGCNVRNRSLGDGRCQPIGGHVAHERLLEQAIAHKQALNQEPAVAASDLAQSAGANRALNAVVTSRLVHDALEESAHVNRALNQEPAASGE